MYCKSCRLTIADRSYFGGTTPDFPQRSFSEEWPQLKKGFQGNINQFEQFATGGKDPILKMLYAGAPDYFSAAQDVVKGGPSPLLEQLTSLVSDPNYLSGRVGTQELRDVVDQPTLAKFASMGNIGGNQAAIQNFLNREQFVEGRKQSHLGTAAGIEGLGEQSQESRFNIGAKGFAVPQSVFGTAVSGYKGLTDPVWQYLSDLFSSNQNAASAESLAGANAKSGQAGGIMSTIGSVVGAVATAY